MRSSPSPPETVQICVVHLITCVVHLIIRLEKISRVSVTDAKYWHCRNFCGRGRVDHHEPFSNMMANWVLASHHSRGGIFYFSVTWRKTRLSNFIAASSFGK
jgi:hypothetical protein